VLGVAHPDANIIFGTVVDESMGDTVRVTVIAAGFDRWDSASRPQRSVLGGDIPNVFGDDEEEDFSEEMHSDLDVPDFLQD
jgi:cell division protein FtsZ